MRKSALSTILAAGLALLITHSAIAQKKIAPSEAAVDMEALRKYALQVAVKCPDAQLSLRRLPGQGGPANLVAFEMTSKSADEGCTTRKFILYSPTTQQTLTGLVFQLPDDKRPVAQRATEKARELTRAESTVTISPFPLPDGVKAATLSRPTDAGPLNTPVFIDASERFMIIGTRGNLKTPFAKSLYEAMNFGAMAVRRGNPKAAVEIIELSDFQCPTCAMAHKKIEPIIAKNLSKVNYARVDFPLFQAHEWAIPASLGARAIQKVAPAKYWAYVDHVFENQEAISKVPFDKFFQEYCEDHDIPWKSVAPIYRSPAERQQLLETVGRGFGNGVAATPTFIVNGRIIAFGPNGNTMVSEIKKALGK